MHCPWPAVKSSGGSDWGSSQGGSRENRVCLMPGGDVDSLLLKMMPRWYGGQGEVSNGWRLLCPMVLIGMGSVLSHSCWRD